MNVALEGTHLHLKLENQSVWKIMCPWYISTLVRIISFENTESENYQKIVLSHEDLEDFDWIVESIIGKAFFDIYGYVFQMDRELNPASCIFPNPGIMQSAFIDCNENKMPTMKTEFPHMIMNLAPRKNGINWILEAPEVTLTCKQVDRESILEVQFIK